MPEGWQSKARWHSRLTLGPGKALSGQGQSGIATSCFLSHSAALTWVSLPSYWGSRKSAANSQLMQSCLAGAGAEPGVMLVWAFCHKASDPGFVPPPSKLVSHGGGDSSGIPLPR